MRHLNPTGNASVMAGRDAAPRRPVGAARRPYQSISSHYRRITPTPAFDLEDYLKESTAAVNRALDDFLPPASAKPATIHRAMRYSIFAGGKRLRPALCLAAAEACRGSWREALPLACAV